MVDCLPVYLLSIFLFFFLATLLDCLFGTYLVFCVSDWYGVNDQLLLCMSVHLSRFSRAGYHHRLSVSIAEY